MESDSELVETLCAIDGGLTAWEMDFAESVAAQVEAGRPLSEKQRDVIERILERLDA